MGTVYFGSYKNKARQDKKGILWSLNYKNTVTRKLFNKFSLEYFNYFNKIGMPATTKTSISIFAYDLNKRELSWLLFCALHIYQLGIALCIACAKMLTLWKQCTKPGMIILLNQWWLSWVTHICEIYLLVPCRYSDSTWTSWHQESLGNSTVYSTACSG